MVAEVSNPDLIDPIDFTTVLNLLPRTFKGLKNTTSSTNQNDMELIKNYHKSVAIKNSENFMGQAKTIVNRKSEHANNELPCAVQSDDKEEELPCAVQSDDKEEDIVVEMDKGREKERRPGLLGNQRRPKFSLKPNVMSQTNLNLEDMEKEIEKITDPIEFFKAHERLENARKEIQRQTGGVPTNSIKGDISTKTRVRRPGLEGRTVGHKHRYSLVGAGSNDVFSSQIETDFSSQSTDEPTTGTMDQQDPAEESISMDVGLEKDSVAAAQNNVDRLLHELLSPACTALDGDGALPFLQERLQIKPIHVDKLSFPDLDSFRSVNVMAPPEPAGKSRESLLEMESLVRESRNKASTEIHLSTNTSMYQRASPTSPESPLASLSLLQKRLSLKGQTASPFSFRGIDYSPVKSTGKDIGDLSPDGERDHNNEANDTTAEAPDKKASSAACEFQSATLVNDDTAGTNTFQSATLVNDDTAGTNTVSKELPMETVVCSASRSMDAGGPDGVLQEDKVENVCQETATSQQKEIDLEGLQTDLVKETVVCSASRSMDAGGPDGILQDKVENVCQETATSQQKEIDLEGLQTDLEKETVVCSASRSMDACGPDGVLQDKVENVCQETATSQQKETDLEGLQNTDCSGSLLDGVNSTAGEHRSGNGDSLTANNLPMQNSEVEDMRPNGVASEQKEPGFEGLPPGDIGCTASHLDESVSAKGKHQTGDIFSQNPDILTEQHDETYPEPSLNESRKRRAPPGNRTKTQKSRQKNLAGAGTQGESDVRRSTRPRTRPLEYWKGEQFLPGRVQNGSVSALGKLQTGDVLSENSDILPGQHDETYPEPSLNENSKRKTPAENIIEKHKSRRKTAKRNNDESVSATGKHQTADVISQNPEIITEQHAETLLEPSLNENKKKKASLRNKREKQITRRKSLAGAGTKWESGVRRSTRHRIRPLEFWKGERLLYGRVHESLLTVIGVKYESPPKSKTEKPTFRVESYVSDEYKELVENAALH
ncbi:centromere protein C-like isoform X2 [Papaver somniferum]|uniref:centromere protein C-like isoform X2 n=1 Tax=Papaver somniferum TaxID=3469 RepID=UPI000E70049C|nr:centromere protein C-like isoform X2 [Papaver somniferum]